MNDPRISALICAAVAAWLGYTIFSASEAPSTFLLVAQWTFFVLALAGLGAALARLMRERR
jgi:membrane protein DedA with SNARE-associated domain